MPELPEVLEVEFAGGPLDGKKHRMVRIGDRLVAWAHRQAKGIVDVTGPDESRQDSLWERFDYQLDATAPGWRGFRLVEGEKT